MVDWLVGWLFTIREVGVYWSRLRLVVDYVCYGGDDVGGVFDDGFFYFVGVWYGGVFYV